MSLTDKFRPPVTKVCNTCKEDKPIKEYSRTAKSPDGYNWSCRACKKAYDDNKKEQGKENAKTFFDAKFFTLFLLFSTSTAFSQDSTKLDTAWWVTNPPFSGCLKLCVTHPKPDTAVRPAKAFHDPMPIYDIQDGVIGLSLYEPPKPDTLRAILLVTLGYRRQGIAHARMGYVVLAPGKRPVYLDCRKRALKLPQVGWDWREVDLNYKK